MIDPSEVFARYHSAVPRYTSYPTAPQFAPGTGMPLAQAMLSALDGRKPVSVYIHIPFCDRLCWFCGCNTKHTNRYGPISRYVDHVLKEIELLRGQIGQRQPISHLHLGGGSPSLLTKTDMQRLRTALETLFDFTSDTEISVEIDPSDSNAEMFDGLKALGITRASIGVQDFHPDVQRAINRPQTFEDTASVVRELRNMDVTSINMDALYGLPLQSEDRLISTLEQCVSLAPDRMALFGYAHVPWMKKHQQMINEADLASPLERFQHAANAAQFLKHAGYEAIGIDHFAKPTDSMAKAAKTGKLRRNFQGYTTDTAETLIGIGGSSIGYFEGGYVQNIVATGQYQVTVERGQLAADKGYRLTADDKMRGYFIEQLMCYQRVDMAELQRRFEALYPVLLTEVMASLRDDTLGLCKMDDGFFYVPDEARAFTRVVASWFDAHFAPSSAQGRQKFSQAV